MQTSRGCAVLLSFLVMCTVFVTGCRKDEANADNPDVKVRLTMQPDPPQVGSATATLQLSDKNGMPITGASLRFEANMNHAGMTPVFANAKEVDAGKYEINLEFTMGGDWFVLITGTLSDGRKLNRKVDVPGVKSR